jgi:hypothetical protein
MLRLVLSTLIMALASASLLPAQLLGAGGSQNLETLVQSNGQPATPLAVLNDDESYVSLENKFTVDVVVEIRVPPGGAVVAQVTVPRQSDPTGYEHELDAGEYEIWVYEAGQPGAAQKCGYLTVE